MKKGIILFLLVLTGVANAQMYEFGDVPMEQLEMTHYDLDSTASALVLFDKGISSIRYYNNEFQVTFTRHMRVKILTDEGLDLGDISIGYRIGEPEQDLRKIKASSYTLNENGKVIEESVGRRDRFKNKVSDNWEEVKFTIPGLKKGSVYEYSYEIHSSSPVDFPDWVFQREIPTLWSEYEARIPEWFNFLTVTRGYRGYDIQERTSFNDNARIGTGMYAQNYNYSGTEYHFAMSDLPAIDDEPYMKISSDYLSHVRFLLASYQLPGDFLKPVLKPWNELTTGLTKDEDFGGRLTSSDVLTNAVNEAIDGIDDEFEKMVSIYNHVKEVMDWNDKFGIYSFEELEDVYNEGTGSGEAINLILIQMLREAGLTAYPLILSTRSHGEIIRTFPILSQFNHTIAYVEIGEKYFLLDAKNEDRPYNLQPTSNLNGEGLIVVPGEEYWIPVQNLGRNMSMNMVDITVSDSGYTGSLTSQNTGFFAYIDRNDFDYNDLNESAKDHIFSDFENFEVDSTFIIKDVLDQSFDFKSYFSSTNNESNEIIYLNPMVIYNLTETPFTLAERTYPVDYEFTFNRTLIIQVHVPENYAIDEVPQSVLHRLPGGAGEFRRIVQTAGNDITISYKFLINKERFMPEEYEYLKKMYEEMVNKLGELIVLKKV